MQKLSKLSNSILKYLVAAVMLVVALYPKFPFVSVPGTFVSIRFEDFLILLLFIVWFIAVIPEIGKLLKLRLVRAMLIFLIVGAVSFLSAYLLTKTVSFNIGLLHLVRRFEYLIPFFAAMHVIRHDRDSLKFYLNLILIIILVAFLYGIGQKYFKFPIIITQNQEYAKGVALFWTEGSHINSTFAGHYDLAAFLVLALPLVGVVFAVTNGVKSKVVLGLAYLAGLWLLAVAASRISIVSYIVATGSALFLARKYKEIVIMVVVSLVIFGLSSNLLVRYERIIDVVRLGAISLEVKANEEVLGVGEKYIPTPTPVPVFEDRSTSIRLNVEWPRAIRAFQKNPILGTGYSSIGLATDNDYLRLLGEVGIFGFASFFLILLCIFELFIKALPFKRNFKGIELAFVAGCAGGVVGVLINAVFIDVFEASKFAILFWMIIGMVVALLDSNKFKSKNI